MILTAGSADLHRPAQKGEQQKRGIIGNKGRVGHKGGLNSTAKETTWIECRRNGMCGGGVLP